MYRGILLLRLLISVSGFRTKLRDFRGEYYRDHATRVTLSDYLTRQFEKQASHYTFRAKGSGKSGLISVSHCGQEILERTACEITEKGITARFFIGFPANGRTINATELEKILFDFLPVCVQKAFLYRNINHKELEQTILLAEDQTYIRSQLARAEISLPLSQTAPSFRGKAAFPLAQ